MNPLDPKTWPEEMRYLYYERIAIKLDSGMEQRLAEYQARIEVYESHAS